MTDSRANVYRKGEHQPGCLICSNSRWRPWFIILTILWFVATMAGLYRNVIEPLSAGSDEMPLFNGEVGQFEKGLAFEEFLTEHDGEIVRFDCYFSPSDVKITDSDFEDYESRFTIFTETTADESGEKPTHSNSIGVIILVVENEGTSSVFGFNAGSQYLKGYYEVTHLMGTNAGYWHVRLRPVATEFARN